jgi:hypothetical protein
MNLLVWDLVIGLHAVLIQPSPQADDEDRVLVSLSEIDVAGGEDADYRACELSEGFLETASPFCNESAALRDLKETLVTTKEPFTCTVNSLDEAKTVLRTALLCRGGVEVNCDGMELATIRCIQALVESLDGNVDFVSYTLKLFVDAPPATVSEAPVPAPAGSLSLADW